MKINYKCLGLVMFVMLICCVSAASATDVDNITVPDDTSVIEIDDTVDSVEEVEQDRGTGGCDCGDCNCEIEVPTLPTRLNPITLTPSNYTTKFTNDNVFNDANVDEVIFNGNFASNTYKTLKFNQGITITATGSTFNNIGFEFSHEGIVLNDATIIMNAPEGVNCYAIDIENANDAILINNKISYTCGSDNAAYYNYVIKVMDSENVTIYNNTITASLPLKDVDYSNYPNGFPGISYDHVAGVAVENASKFKFTKNVLNVTGHVRGGYFPTLDALLVIKSPNSSIKGNKIYEQDDVTAAEETNYLYAVDIYQCDNLTIKCNKIELNSGSGNLTVNGTGGAYGIQLTGGHRGIVIACNNITTANNGPNLGIYSQNYEDDTYLTIYGNIINVTGRAGDNPWALVSGMELQDTYVNVCNNTVYVNNIGGDYSQCAYGISYSQETYMDHYYDICNNTVIVVNGEYAVYIIDSIVSNVINNGLLTSVYFGDNATDVQGINCNVTGNYHP